MTRLVGRIAWGQVRPWRAGAEHPEDAVEHGASVFGRAPAAIRTARVPKEGFQDGPLRVGEIHATRYDAPSLVVTPTLSDF